MKTNIFTTFFVVMFMLAGHAMAAENQISTGIFSNKAVSGYDTVSYFTQGKAVKGSSEHITQWKGADWLFSSAANLEKFKSNPEKYAPQYGGYCAWAVAHDTLASSDPEQWHIENGKLYLNYDKSIKSKWLPRRGELIPSANRKFSSLIGE